VLTEVATLDPWRQLVPHQLPGRLREQDLAAVARREHPRRPIQRGAEVIPIALLCDPAVQDHANSDATRDLPRLVVQRPLGIERRGHGVGSAREDRTELVAHSLEDIAAVRLDCVSQEPFVTGERIGHLATVLLPEEGAALDVGEEKGDRAGGQVGHGRLGGPARG
jgi:hypothetical protein